jgi:fructose-1,6-bisphosphatase I
MLGDSIIINCLKSSEKVFGLISEEQPDMIFGNSDAKYIVAFDPLDGSTNIEVNVTIGSIFSIYRRKKDE